MVGLAIRSRLNGVICVRARGLVKALTSRAALAVWADATVGAMTAGGSWRRGADGEWRWAAIASHSKGKAELARGRWPRKRGCGGGFCAPGCQGCSRRGLDSLHV
jgi:hypothetical protein